jgi:hypothetical protein
MGLRFMICPVVGDGTNGVVRNPYRPKIDGLAPYSAVIPSNEDGTPKFTWCACIARSDDWSAVDADAEMDRIFGIDLPDTIDTFAEVKAFLKSHTVGDIPAARRQAMDLKLTSRGVDTSPLTLQSTWLQVLALIFRHLLGYTPGEDDVRVNG